MTASCSKRGLVTRNPFPSSVIVETRRSVRSVGRYNFGSRAAAIAAGTLTGERFTGHWVDVGTPQRLAELDNELRDQERKTA